MSTDYDGLQYVGIDLWRAPASVDSHRSGTMVYEEKNRSGIDTPEVHC